MDGHVRDGASTPNEWQVPLGCALFEMDKETFFAKIGSVGKIINRKAVRLHHERDTFRLYMEGTLDHITNRIEEGGLSFPLDDWAEPSPNVFLGGIGMLVDKN